VTGDRPRCTTRGCPVVFADDGPDRPCRMHRERSLARVRTDIRHRWPPDREFGYRAGQGEPGGEEARQ
jgi:hypothetical protein